jgi:hypothetical protein
MSHAPLTFCHPEDGFLQFGEERDGEITRKKNCQLAGGSGASLRVFKDGGWELRASPNDLGSNILQRGTGPLNIYSDGDLKIECKEKLTLRAKDIVMESTGTKGDIIARPNNDFRVEARNNIKMTGTMGAMICDHRLILASKGAVFVRGNPIRFVEPRSKLIPTSFNDFIEEAINTFLIPGG